MRLFAYVRIYIYTTEPHNPVKGSLILCLNRTRETPELPEPILASAAACVQYTHTYTPHTQIRTLKTRMVCRAIYTRIYIVRNDLLQWLYPKYAGLAYNLPKLTDTTQRLHTQSRLCVLVQPPPPSISQAIASHASLGTESE